MPLQTHNDIRRARRIRRVGDAPTGLVCGVEPSPNTPSAAAPTSPPSESVGLCHRPLCDQSSPRTSSAKLFLAQSPTLVADLSDLRTTEYKNSFLAPHSFVAFHLHSPLPKRGLPAISEKISNRRYVCYSDRAVQTKF